VETTEDSILRNDIRIRQPVHGYRFAVDAVLLAHFLQPEPGMRCLEIGAGTGVISILLNTLQQVEEIVAVELQPELAELCRQNFVQNRVRGSVLETDARTIQSSLPAESFDLIYSNPPYRKTGSGRLNPSVQKAIARHEIKLKLQDLFECAKHFLRSAGRLSMILPTFREADFNHIIRRCGFFLRRTKYVRSFAHEAPAFFLSDLSKTAGPLAEIPSLVIYETPGVYTPEMSKLLRL